MAKPSGVFNVISFSFGYKKRIEPHFFVIKIFFNIERVFTFKGTVHPKMKILSVFTHPHVVPTP